MIKVVILRCQADGAAANAYRNLRIARALSLGLSYSLAHAEKYYVAPQGKQPIGWQNTCSIESRRKKKKPSRLNMQGGETLDAIVLLQ